MTLTRTFSRFARIMLALVTITTLALAQSPAPAKADTPAQPAPKTDSSPLSFHIGDAEFTPGGFIDATAWWRSADVGSGTATSFTGIPYGNTVAGKMSETRLSTQNSRITLRMDSTVAGAKVMGWLETDFSGNAPTSLAVVSNSATLRLRQAWVDVSKGQWEVLGGQAWSLMSPNRTGVGSKMSDMFLGWGTDANYLAGLSWSRGTTVRGVWHPNKQWAWAFAAEGAEQYIGGAVTLPTLLSSGLTSANELNSGGTTVSTPNPAVDVTTKLAFDNPRVHLEFAGGWRHFRIENPLNFTKHSAEGVMGGLNSSFLLSKNLRFVENLFVSDGGGRYIGGIGPDLIVRPDCTISPIHSGSTVDGFELNAGAKDQLFAYYSGVYFSRNVAIDTNGTRIGYGVAGSTTANRTLQEGTFGWTHTFWKNPRYGALQTITQYAYVWRNPWAPPSGVSSKTKLDMVFVDLHYVLP